MPDILQLESFYLTRLSVIWHAPEPAVEGKTQFVGAYTIDYDVLRRKSDDRLFALKVRFHMSPARKPVAGGYQIDAEIFGAFRFPKSMSEDDMQKLVRLNGTVILYGILRGEVAAFTGSFPGGKFLLPTIYMPEIVAKVENSKKTTTKTQVPETAPQPKRRKKKALT